MNVTAPRIQDAPEMERIRAAAREAMRRHAEIACILLFGSRARGTHRPNSDYDIAVVAVDGTDKATLNCRELIPQHLLGDCRLDAYVIDAGNAVDLEQGIGSLAYELRSDGRPLAGRWNPPREPDIMPPRTTPATDEAAASNLGQMAQFIEAAGCNRAKIAGHWNIKDAKRQYQYATQLAGEMWGKAVLITFGVSPSWLHDMKKLSEGIVEGADWERWRDAVLSLNGETHDLHMSVFADQPVRPLPDSDRRFLRTMRVIADWFESRHLIATARPDNVQKRRSMLATAARQTSQSIEMIRLHPKAGALPKTIVAAIDRLDACCAVLRRDGKPRGPRQGTSA